MGPTHQAEIYRGPGGTAYNQAVAATRLGAVVHVVGRIGADPDGRDIMDGLEAEGVGLAHVGVDADVATGVTVALVEPGREARTVSAPGANARLEAWEVRAAAGAIEEADVLLCQLDVPYPAVAEAVGIAGQAITPVVLGPAPVLLGSDDVVALLAQVEVVVPSAAEANRLTGVEVNERASAAQAGRRLLASGAGLAAVPAAAEGTLLCWAQGEAWEPALDVEVVDTTGAGDAYAAALAVCLSEGTSRPEAAAFANAAAALATTALGGPSALPRRAEVLALLEASGRLSGPAPSGPG